MNKQDFISNIYTLVDSINNNYGYKLFNSVVIAQAILETGWGSSKLMMKANAIFGIKATINWKGKVYNAKTYECYDNVNYTSIYDSFRAYDTLQESVEDYFKLITGLSRYSKALNRSTPLECITAIKEGGYATSPTYVNSIMNIIRENNLERFDKNVSHETQNIDELARRVINGEYGNGEERKQKLGNLYDKVQSRVNELLNVKQNDIYYTVKKGDCLCNIAKKYNTTVQKIAEDNGIENVDLIYVNQKLLIRR